MDSLNNSDMLKRYRDDVELFHLAATAYNDEPVVWFQDTNYHRHVLIWLAHQDRWLLINLDDEKNHHSFSHGKIALVTTLDDTDDFDPYDGDYTVSSYYDHHSGHAWIVELSQLHQLTQDYPSLIVLWMQSS